jgi:biotin carboxyl carrier protein
VEEGRTGRRHAGAAVRFVALENGEPIDVEVQRHGSGYRVRLDDRWIEVDLVNAGRFMRSVRLADGTQVSLIHHRDGVMHHITLGDRNFQVEIIDPLSLKRRRVEDEMGGGGVVKALMPGRVVRVLVAKGEAVKKGAGLLILEAMKMENEIQAPVDGVVEELFVDAGQTVESGSDLARIGAS